MKMLSRFMAASALLFAGAFTARAQATDVPCKAAACVFFLDWGSGKTSGSYPPDRRYGSGDDFESRFRTAMGARGFRLTDTPAASAMTVTIRPTMKSRVMCDALPGLNTDLSCTAMIGLAVSFGSGDPAVKAPSAIRITNRCASGNIFMLNREFAQYSADMIWWQLEGQAAKGDRPIVNC